MQEATKEDLVSPEPEGEEGLSFYATLANAQALNSQALEVRFTDLCTPCKRTIKALLEQVGKKIVGVSPDRKVEKKVVAKPVAKEKATAPSHGASPDPVHATAVSRTPAGNAARA